MLRKRIMISTHGASHSLFEIPYDAGKLDLSPGLSPLDCQETHCKLDSQDKAMPKMKAMVALASTAEWLPGTQGQFARAGEGNAEGAKHHVVQERRAASEYVFHASPDESAQEA